jgi:hypothetical protein
MYALYALLNMYKNVSEPHLVGLASTHREEGGPEVVEITE